MTIAPPEVLLVRYGRVSEVARFPKPLDFEVARGQAVVVRTHRGLELGTVLERVRTLGRPANGHDEHELDAEFVRSATEEDHATARRLRDEANASWKEWIERIAQWKLELELLDLEWTLDKQKLILYVLAGRGPDTTKLALFAAAKGFPVDVQPVAADGLVTLPSEGGCGSGSCGCHE